VENRFEARSIVVRTYVANGGDSIAVLPGGLTRVSKTAEDPVVSMQSGGGSKDTWVLANGAADRPEAAQAFIESRVAERTVSGTPSRAADNLFWLGRYTERLEQTLRVLRCVIGRISDEAAGEGSTVLAALATLMANLDLFASKPGPRFHTAELQRQVLHLIYEPDITGSVRELLGRIRFIASNVRDRFSGDTWRILGRLDMDAAAAPGRLPLANALALIHTLVLHLAAFNGMEMENMTRGQGWRFLDLGRRLERAQSIVKLLRAALGVETRLAAVLEPVLEIADSVMTYRQRHFAEARLSGVLGLLLRENSNPRSLAFQLEILRAHARELPGGLGGLAPRKEEERIAAISHALEAVDLDDLVAAFEGGRSGPLLEWLDGGGRQLAEFSDDLTSRYFSHTIPRVG
jgi:uncharacterized alpha-E superfamily protein